MECAVDLRDGNYRARVLADSLGPARCRLVTMELTFPRFILAEFNTHRLLSRNSASSRAIPTAKLLERVKVDPFVPEAFGRNQKGMSAGTWLETCEGERAREHWLWACNRAVQAAELLAGLEVHKQTANRLLEPFLWHTVIASATEWANFFWLRCHPDAQPEMQKIANLAAEAYHTSEPSVHPSGGWHLPLIDDTDWEAAGDRWPHSWKERIEGVSRVSAARCARVSYLTHDGRRDLDADLALADRLRESGHWSPFEHVATALDEQWEMRPDARRVCGNFRGWAQLRKIIAGNEHRDRYAHDWRYYAVIPYDEAYKR
jgi:thymidylate synthase ThyX